MHSKTVCRRCGTTVAQCRCPEPHKQVRYVDSCGVCRQQVMQPVQVDCDAPNPCIVWGED